MSSSKTPAQFGTCLGYAPGQVPVYSSHEDSHGNSALKTRDDYRSHLDGLFMGYKWQCVEFARRWLYLNKGYVFADISMAYDIFELRSVRCIQNNTLLPLKSFKNGAKRWPEPGCLLIWAEGGYFADTGHVAIVAEVRSDGIDVIEQNVEQTVWPEGQSYSRSLKAHVTDQGGYWIDDDMMVDARLLGWVIQTEDAQYAEVIKPIDPNELELQLKTRTPSTDCDPVWLNPQEPDESAFISMMGGHKLVNPPADPNQYLCLSEAAHKELKHASNELHAMFMHATYHVLQHDAHLERFNIPRHLWPKLHASWENRKNQMVAGRFDFSMTKQGLKLFEYNADSASCLLECGKIQGKWAMHHGCDVGRDPGEDLFYHLVNAWRHNDVSGLLHILQDDTPEEHYHAQYMKKAIVAAGIPCKIIVGLSRLHRNNEGRVVDEENIPLKWVWKTWAWETALQQVRDASSKPSSALRLADVLLQNDVMVYEPLWTLIPSNKAILPILWNLFPDNPYLLNSQYERTPDLVAQGYVTKPIAGYAGDNIRIFNPHDDAVMSQTHGRFCHQNHMYQAFFPLPKLGGYYIQLAAFTVDGKYAGATARMDQSPIITASSDVLPMRIVS